MTTPKKTKLPAHPLQPVYVDDDGVARCRENAIVRFLLDAGPFDMNKLSMMPFDREDREQFAQLIGYSVSGLGDLGYVSDRVISKLDAAVEKLMGRSKVLGGKKTKRVR